MDVTYVVVTNELDVQRLDKILNQPCVDVLVHVHLDLVERLAGGLPARLGTARSSGRLVDLTELAQSTHSWG